jgi:hypothetical protein
MSDDKVQFNQRFGEANGNAKLTKRQVDTIRASNLSTRTLADHYGVTVRAILKIKRGETWSAASK